MKKTALIFAFVLLIGMMSGCGNGNTVTPGTGTQQETTAKAATEGSKDADAKPLNIFFATPLVGHPVWLDCKKGFEDAMKEGGATGQWVGPQGIDIEAQINNIENAIAQKVDAIITCDLEKSAFAPVLKKAKDAGIPVAFINTDDPDSGRLISVGTEPINVVRKAAPEVIKALNGKAPKVILMQSNMTVQTQIDQVNEYKSIFGKLAGYKLNSLEVDEPDMLKDTDKIYNLFRTYPDTNVLVTVAANGAPAAGKVIKENKFKDIIVVGVDDLPETIEGIKNGTILGTCTQNFYKMGYEATKALIEFKKTGKKPEKDVVDSGTIFVSKANIDTYKEEMKK